MIERDIPSWTLVKKFIIKNIFFLFKSYFGIAATIPPIIIVVIKIIIVIIIIIIIK